MREPNRRVRRSTRVQEVYKKWCIKVQSQLLSHEFSWRDRCLHRGRADKDVFSSSQREIWAVNPGKSFRFSLIGLLHFDVGFSWADNAAGITRQSTGWILAQIWANVHCSLGYNYFGKICSACFLSISLLILNRFRWNFAQVISKSCPNISKTFAKYWIF